jgi:hypothetical protein
MSNDCWIDEPDDEMRCSEEEMMAAHDEYHWHQSQLPEHKRDGYAEQMYEQADLRRKELKENRL